MKPHAILCLTLAMAFALGDLASICYINATHQRWPDLPGVILLGLVFAQQMMLAVWFTFARWNIVLRVLISLALVSGLAVVASEATDGRNTYGPWIAIQMVAFGFFATPLGISKLVRFHLGSASEFQAAANAPAWQFSIWTLLSCTTAVAIAVAAARQANLPLVTMGEAIAFLGCVSATGLIVFFVAISIRSQGKAALAALPAVFLVAPVGGMLTGGTGLPPVETPQCWALFGCCYGATIAVPVLVLRVAGLQLRRLPRRVPTSEDTAGDGGACDRSVNESLA